MKRLLVIPLILFSAVLLVAQAQIAVVRRNTYLRDGPSTNDKKIMLLKTGDEPELIDSVPSSPSKVRTW